MRSLHKRSNPFEEIDSTIGLENAIAAFFVVDLSVVEVNYQISCHAWTVQVELAILVDSLQQFVTEIGFRSASSRVTVFDNEVVSVRIFWHLVDLFRDLVDVPHSYDFCLLYRESEYLERLEIV